MNVTCYNVIPNNPNHAVDLPWVAVAAKFTDQVLAVTVETRIALTIIVVILTVWSIRSLRTTTLIAINQVCTGSVMATRVGGALIYFLIAEFTGVAAVTSTVETPYFVNTHAITARHIFAVVDVRFTVKTCPAWNIAATVDKMFTYWTFLNQAFQLDSEYSNGRKIWTVVYTNSFRSRTCTESD